MNSIIIPTLCPTIDVKHKLLECLGSIARHTVRPFELVLVEQGDRIVTGDKVLAVFDNCVSLPGEKQTLIYTADKLGYARAVNIGVKAASASDYIFIVNNDITVPPRWDEDLINAYERPITWPGGARVMGMLSPIEQGRCVKSNSFIFNESWWSCVLMNRRVWNVVGELDDVDLNYRLHDQDWSIRCHKAGYGVGRYCGVVVQHEEASTYRHLAPEVNESAERAIMRERHGVEHFFQWVTR